MQRKSTLANLTIHIGNTLFENPIWVASGTFGYGTDIRVKVTRLLELLKRRRA